MKEKKITLILGRSAWMLLFLLSMTAYTAAQSQVTFNVTSDGAPVRGITVDVDGIALRTDASGNASIYLPDGDYTYYVYTATVNEGITIGSHTFNYLDAGRDESEGNEDRYNNLFLPPTTLTVTGETTETIQLLTTTFNTTIGGTAASAEFNILGEYINSGGSTKTKLITTIISDADGTIDVPLPTHRDDRHSNILSFDTYFMEDVFEHSRTSFDPMASPIAIDIPPLNTLTMAVTAAGQPVQGVYVEIADQVSETSAQGEVSFELPDGNFVYSVFTDGGPETLTIGTTTYTYEDSGERDGEENSYENIFVANAPLIHSGAATVDVSLGISTFLTKVNGADAMAEFEIIGIYSGDKDKTITRLTTDASGNIILPLPTHRSTRQGDTLAFSEYQYRALSGFVNSSFDPAATLVTIDIPETHTITFQVDAGGVAVKGLTIDVGGLNAVSNASGELVMEIPAGDVQYSAFTTETANKLTMGSLSLSYLDFGGNSNTGRYNNIFALDVPFTVTADATVSVSLVNTTFQTMVGGTAAPSNFEVQADYLNRNGALKTKSIITLSSGADGTVALPLPTHRDDRQGNILSFDAFHAASEFGTLLSDFDPLSSPVVLNIAQSNQLTFTIQAGGTAVQGISVKIAGMMGKTDQLGQVQFMMPDDTYYYTLYIDGNDESIIIGEETFNYMDIGGRDDREDRYDNIFAANAPVIVSGTTTENVDLQLTSFKTRTDGVEASATFDIIAEYSGGKIKTIAQLTSDASGNIVLPLPTHRNNRQDDTLAFSYYQFWAFSGTVNDTFELDDDPVYVDFPVVYELTFQVEASGTAVEGISIKVNDEVLKTDASGQVTLTLPAGEFQYMVYTANTPETITYGDKTFTFMDEGENNRLDAYDNIFVKNSPVTITGNATQTISLATTTFQTSIGGTAAPLKFDISAGYTNERDIPKRKNLVVLESEADGSLTLPLPTHRSNREYEDTLEYYNFHYSDLALSTQGIFDPNDSPVEINVPEQHQIIFTIKAGATPVEGMTVALNKLTGVSDATGQVVLDLPAGDYDYTLQTAGFNETLVVGPETFAYLDLGGSGYENRYDNIFDKGLLEVSTAASIDLALLTPNFKTTRGGVTMLANFIITGIFDNRSGDTNKKNLISATSHLDGEISFPLPKYRDDREGNILAFTDYGYSDLPGTVSGDINPADDPVLIALLAASEVSFMVTSGGDPVEGITIGIKDLIVESDASGEVLMNLPDGNFEYEVYTAGRDESLRMNGTTFNYFDKGGNADEWIAELGYDPNHYDNVFDFGEIDVTGAATHQVDIGSTTFETTLNGTATPVALLISGDYINDDSELKNKDITVFSTGTDGSASLPIPKYRDDRRGSVLPFITYHYADISETATGIFDPELSPVIIAFSNLNEVVFVLRDSQSSDPVEGAIVHVDGIVLEASGVSGETGTSLAAGSYHYTVSVDGFKAVESTSFDVNEALTTVYVDLINTTGVHEVEENSFMLYPNPARELVTLQFTEPYSGSIEVYSILGSRVIHQQINSAPSAKLSLSGLESGIYLVKVGTRVQRLMVQ